MPNTDQEDAKLALAQEGTDKDAELCLAQEGTDALPPRICKKGFSAIDTVAFTVLGAFQEDSHHSPLVGTPEMASLLHLLQLDDKLQTLGLDLSSTDDIGTPASLIGEIAKLSKLNPILVTAAAEFSEQPNCKQSFPAPGMHRDADLRMAVVYCYLLHLISKAVVDEPIKTELQEGEATFSEKLFGHFEALKKSSKWGQYFSLFENAKMDTVKECYKFFILRYKNGISRGPERHLRGLALSINIFEAMMQDVKMGYTDNAWCGFELMLEPGNQAVKGTDGTTDYFWRPLHGGQSGALCARSPLPIIWNNLYISWNLAFVSKQYSDWPLFFAKLLNPVVFGSYHQVDPGLFMMPRGVALYVQLAFMGLQRSHAKGIVEGPWKNELLNEVLGRVNRQAARQYKERIENIVREEHGPSARLGYVTKRRVCGMAWRGLSFIITNLAGKEHHEM